MKKVLNQKLQFEYLQIRAKNLVSNWFWSSEQFTGLEVENTPLPPDMNRVNGLLNMLRFSFYLPGISP